MATPCRSGGGAGPGVFSPSPNEIAEDLNKIAEDLNLDIPQMDDKNADRPVAGAMRLSSVAVESRLRRV